MARETALWQKCFVASKALRNAGHLVDTQRIENLVGAGHPDVEGCIDGKQLWIELKSCSRPVRADTPIRPKARPSQEIWHRMRTNAGCRFHWILIQVGEDRSGVLYLIPGSRYKEIIAPEAKLAEMSCVPANATTADVLLRSIQGW